MAEMLESVHPVLLCHPRRGKVTVKFLSTLAFAIVIATSVHVHAAPAAPRPEFPRPDLQRTEWQSLNGPWHFAFDDADAGLKQRWFESGHKLDREIVVPYAFETELSGIHDTSMHDVLWYRRELKPPASFSGKHIILHFGAVNYQATVWVNGMFAGEHTGGQTGFELDITDLMQANGNVVTLRVHYPSRDQSLPRGKQYWERDVRGIWYDRTTGIWQPVWLEAVNATHVDMIHVTPDVDAGTATVVTRLNKPADAMQELHMRLTVKLHDRLVAQEETLVNYDHAVSVSHLPQQALWSPEHPNLYDLTVEIIENGKVIDTVQSYFGQRKVDTRNGRFFLNNAPYYLRLVLDQGYWPQSLLTPPDDAAMQYDINTTKAIGFNGARKHQKVEDPRWLYFADKLGLIVWGEMANAQVYNEEYVQRFTAEWEAAIERDYSHPSIIAWVPLNESWGVHEVRSDKLQQEHARAMYHLIHSLDATRPVIDNDGWEHTESTDIFTVHDYTKEKDAMIARYKGLSQQPVALPFSGRSPLADGSSYNGAPVMITEFGGIAYRLGDQKATAKDFGYSGVEPTKEAFLKRLDDIVAGVRANPNIYGYCYTQLTDVMQEINGVMTYDRKLKASPEELHKIFAQEPQLQ